VASDGCWRLFQIGDVYFGTKLGLALGTILSAARGRYELLRLEICLGNSTIRVAESLLVEAGACKS